MVLKTRYRILFNGEQYKIQHQTFRLTLFGRHWKRKWVDLEYHDALSCLRGIAGQIQLFRSLRGARGECDKLKVNDKNQRKTGKLLCKEKLAMKKNMWKKV